MLYSSAMEESMSSESARVARSVEQERIELGRRVRKLRLDKGWKLADVAERSRLAASTISKAERGLIALRYDSMRQLAHAMDVDMAELISPQGEPFTPGSFAVAPKGTFKRQQTPNYVYEMLFSEIHNKAMTPMFGTLRANELVDFEDFVRHPGQEFLLVLEGAVTVFVEGRPPVTLRQGDSIYFDSARGHLYAAAGAQDARILVVCTDAGFDDGKPPRDTA